MLVLKHCSVSYGSYSVFKDLSFSAEAGDILTIAGPSGCGKTSLLYLLAGIKPPEKGSVSLSNTPVDPGDPRVSIIFQEYGLFPWFTALENAALGLRIQGVGKKERLNRAREELAKLGLEKLGSRYPGELSGGQKQRVALARSLVLEPDLLLMDEPFSALDSVTRELLQDLLWDILSKRKIVTILVTHSIEEAVFLGTRILLMSQGPESVLTEFPGCSGERKGGLRREEKYFALCSELRGSMEKNL